jgi:glycosyltransferase involved in cell wall biosynthesis
VVVTTRNESTSIVALLTSLVDQTTHPGEIVICDASTDDTLSKIQAFAESSPIPIRVITRPEANISQGRNTAIQAAQGEIVAVTDAGVRLPPHWLAKIVAPLAGPQVHAVAGFFAADAQTPFEVAMGATVLPLLEEIEPAQFLPSSRSIAFRKSAWQAVGGYPEWLDFCEDIVYDIKLLDTFGPFAFAPEAVAAFRPRPNLRSFVHQYYTYARGDGKAGLNWRQQHLPRFAAFGFGFGAIAFAIILERALPQSLDGVSLYILSLVPLLGVIALRSWSPYHRLVRIWGGLDNGQKRQALLLVPVIRLLGELAKLVGYPMGALWRWRHRKRPELHWKIGSRIDHVSSGPSRTLF